MFRLILSVCLAGIFPTSFLSGLNSSVQIINPNVTYTFGDKIIFQATIQSDIPISDTFIFFQAENDATRTGQVNIDSKGNLTFAFDARQQAIRPFARIYYWFHGTLTNGEKFSSPSFWFDYIDNRFVWQNVEDAVFRVRWYQGDLALGQNALNVAHSGLENIQTLLPLVPPIPLDIYIYSDANDLQSVLQIDSQSTILGHASPDLGVVMVTIPPGPEQNLEMERQIPHEMAHIMIYQATGVGYSKLPVWLNEGVASLSELYPNPDYQRLLINTQKENKLFPISSLCQSFPKNFSETYLAYAQSASFTRFLHQKYGTSKLQTLLNNYSQGMDCENGIKEVYSLTLNELDEQWQGQLSNQSIKEDFSTNIIPYLILLVGITIFPLGIVLVNSSIQKKKKSGSGVNS
jgi:hypothetical protein